MNKNKNNFRIGGKKANNDKGAHGKDTGQPEHDQETYYSKGKKAIEKLRLIKQYVESFKKIIDRCNLKTK